jgi:hypothetical protein
VGSEGEVTAADREKATRLRSDWTTFRAGDGHLSIGMKEEHEHVELIAQALADERAKVRLPFLRAIEAAEISLQHDVPMDWPAFLTGLRRAAEDPT